MNADSFDRAWTAATGTETIRMLQPEEREAAMRLNEFAFQMTLPDDERERRLREAPNGVVWGMFAKDQLMAKVEVLPLEAWIGGRSFAMGGVAGVATWPEYRRGGRVARLIAHALREMKRDGQVLSFLHPFDFGFYRKYGWETYVDRKICTVETALLPMRPISGPGRADTAEAGLVGIGLAHAGTGVIRRVPPEEGLAALEAVYVRYARRFSGMLNRRSDWWRRRVFTRKPGQIALYTGANGEAEGYLIYQVKDRVMTVHEWAALSDSAWRDMWAFVCNHDSMIDRAVLTLPMAEDLAFRLANPRIQTAVEPYFMARIVDLAAFLEDYPFLAADGATELHLTIEDPAAEWNRGVYALRIPASGGGASIRRLAALDGGEGEWPGGRAGTPASGEAAPLTIGADIQTMTALLLGYRSAADLHALGRLNGQPEAVEALQKRLASRPTYLADFF